VFGAEVNKFFATIFAFLFAQQVYAACLPYSPAVVTISGKLEELTFPGRPNFQDVRQGDEPETGFYLSLPAPICTVGEADSPDAYPQKSIVLVQLLLNQDDYDKLRPLLGKNISISGTLMAAFTGHHHAPVVIDKVSLVGNSAR
jgi:hypothetical protein